MKILFRILIVLMFLSVPMSAQAKKECTSCGTLGVTEQITVNDINKQVTEYCSENMGKMKTWPVHRAIKKAEKGINLIVTRFIDKGYVDGITVEFKVVSDELWPDSKKVYVELTIVPNNKKPSRCVITGRLQ
jgi:hypothetical protein